MESPFDFLAEIARVLREANQPVEVINEQSLVWQELLLLVDAARQPPDLAPRPQGYRVMQEFPFVATTGEGALRIQALLHELGFEPKHTYTKYGRTVVPVYSNRHLWLGRLLDLARRGPGRAPLSTIPVESGALAEDPSDLDAIVRSLRQAGQAEPGLEEKARAWSQVRPLVVGYRRPLDPARRAKSQAHRTRWELGVSADNPDAPAKLSQVLRQLGLAPGRPFVQGDRVVVPVSGERHHWLRLLLGPQLSETPPEAPKRTTKPAAPPARARNFRTMDRYDDETALQIVAKDPTFRRSTWRGQAIFAGRCARCAELLMVGLDGAQVSRTCIARVGEGDELVLVCFRCAARNQRREPVPAPSEPVPAPSPRPPAPPAPAPPLVPLDRLSALAAIARVLHEAGRSPETLDEQVRVWCELLPSSRAGRDLKGERELQFIVPTLTAAARAEALLRQLGIRASRPYEEKGRIIVPVKEKRHPWLGALLALGKLPD